MSEIKAFPTPKTPEKLVCFFKMPDSEVFLEQKDSKPLVTGYAAKFDRYSQDLGGYRVKIDKAAFNDVLTSADCRFLVNHDKNLLFGRTKSGTLRIFADDVGLGFECVPPESSLWDHYAAEIGRGDMDGCSFSCYIDVDQWDFSGETAIRTIVHVSDLLDLGPVTYPAFVNTSVVCHSLEAARAAARLLLPRPKHSLGLMAMGLELARSNAPPTMEI